VSRVSSPTFRDSLSVSFTVGAYGVAFGAAAVANGFSVLQSCLLSLLTFSGASQFAVVGVIGAGGSAISAIATASLLGIRNGLYGVLAKAMGDPSAWGLDAAVPAAFLGLVWPRLKSSTDKTLAVVAAIFAIATTPFLPAGLPIIGTALLAVIAGLWVKK